MFANRYILITAAKNEADYIEEVIRHVVRQTITPIAWFIVDDGSTDQTAEIVNRWAGSYPWIRLFKEGTSGGRSFGSQYKALMFAWEQAKRLDFEFLGIVDADQAPAPRMYYEAILEEFQRNPELGMASGYVHERDKNRWQARKSNSVDSAAASAVFRRECFEQIGGYRPLPLGGSDWLAQLETKRLGWQICVRQDLPILHYRPTSSAGGIYRGRFREGQMDASFGSLFAFEAAKCARRLKNHPIIIGSVIRMAGYLKYRLTAKPLLTPEQIKFLRKEQHAKLRA